MRKKDVIEAIDRSFFSTLLDGLDLSSVRLCVTADHSTPCVVGAHSDDPVPWILAGSGIPAVGPARAGKFGSKPTGTPTPALARAADVLPSLFSGTPSGAP